MGMYTELVLKCEVSGDSPDIVKNVVRHLFGGGDRPEQIPEHEFFKCHRWSSIGSGSSAYHLPEAISNVFKYDWDESLYVFSRSDLKNYDDEIAKFVDWITPHLVAHGETCIGWSWYEDDEKPTLIVINKGE